MILEHGSVLLVSYNARPLYTALDTGRNPRIGGLAVLDALSLGVLGDAGARKQKSWGEYAWLQHPLSTTKMSKHIGMSLEGRTYVKQQVLDIEVLI